MAAELGSERLSYGGSGWSGDPWQLGYSGGIFVGKR